MISCENTLDTWDENDDDDDKDCTPANDHHLTSTTILSSYRYIDR